ncbi:hypothetical protein LTR74_003520 [Friedmanniomyces endolithicus]|nr:hypothetical protein LTR74_003520 [Friedmanniomyces endolithicus]
MQPYGQQAAVPQPQQQWQSGNGSTGQQQQGSTTTQTTTTTTQTRLIAQQAQLAYAMTPQPVQWPYAATPQQVQLNNSQAQSAYQYPAQQQMMPMQAAPPTPAVQQADYSHLMKDAPAEAPVNNQLTTTSTTTSGKVVSSVESMIATLNLCPLRCRWYAMDDGHGYICACGMNHVPQDLIDQWTRNPQFRPSVLWVNKVKETFDLFIRGDAVSFSAHPPEIDLWQPMHKQHRDFIAQCAQVRQLPASVNRDQGCKCTHEMQSTGNLRPATAENAFMHANMQRSRPKNSGYGFGFN